MMRLCAMHGGYHSLMLNDVRRDIDAIKCRWVPYSVQLAAEDTPALVTATRVCRLQPVASMATRKDCEEGEGGDECKVEPILRCPRRGATTTASTRCTQRHRMKKTATTEAL